MVRFFSIALIALVFAGCEDAPSSSPSPSKMLIPKFVSFQGFASESQRGTVIYSIAALRAAPEPGTYLTLSDRINRDVWVQMIYNEAGQLNLDIVSQSRGKPDAPSVAVYDFIDGPVTIDNGIETTMLSSKQVNELHQLLREYQLKPMVVHLGAKSEDGKWEGYHCSQQAVLDSLSDEQLTNLVFEIFRRVHRLEKVSGVAIALDNNKP